MAILFLWYGVLRIREDTHDHKPTAHPTLPLLRSDDHGLGWQHGEGIVTFKKHGILGNRMRCLICRRCGAVLFQWVAEPHRFPPIR